MAVPYLSDPTATGGNCGLLCGEVCVAMLLANLAIDCPLDAVCGVTHPGDPAGTPINALVGAAQDLGAAGSYYTFVKKRQARRFLRDQVPFVAVVAPSGLYGTPPVPWGHAVVALEVRDQEVIYHDPDPVMGGAFRSMRLADFLDAWQKHSYAAVVVKR